MPNTPLPGDKAPALDLDLIIGTKWSLADQEPEAFTQIVVYRGLHCPLCKEYLSKMRSLYDDFLGKGIETIHVSMDSEDRARQAHEDWGLDPIPMGYGLSEEQARGWGLYLSDPIQDTEKGRFAEPGLFWVRPSGELYLADIGSAPFVRPDLDMLLSKVDLIRENDYPPRGRVAA